MGCEIRPNCSIGEYWANQYLVYLRRVRKANSRVERRTSADPHSTPSWEWTGDEANAH